METTQLEISPTVLDAMKNLGSGPVCAADFVCAILSLFSTGRSRLSAVESLLGTEPVPGLHHAMGFRSAGGVGG